MRLNTTTRPHYLAALLDAEPDVVRELDIVLGHVVEIHIVDFGDVLGRGGPRASGRPSFQDGARAHG